MKNVTDDNTTDAESGLVVYFSREPASLNVDTGLMESVIRYCDEIMYMYNGCCDVFTIMCNVIRDSAVNQYHPPYAVSVIC